VFYLYGFLVMTLTQPLPEFVFTVRVLADLLNSNLAICSDLSIFNSIFYEGTIMIAFFIDS